MLWQELAGVGLPLSTPVTLDRNPSTQFFAKKNFAVIKLKY